jgi:hypothetical protein
MADAIARSGSLTLRVCVLFGGRWIEPATRWPDSHQALSHLAARGERGVEVHTLRVHRDGREKDVVGIGDRPAASMR